MSSYPAVEVKGEGEKKVFDEDAFFLEYKRHEKEMDEFAEKYPDHEISKGRRRMKEKKEGILQGFSDTCAKAAVEFYNEKHLTKYELVEALDYKCIVHNKRQFWSHSNFRAKQLQGEAELFFTELRAGDVNSCFNLDALGPGETVGGCPSCPDQLIHPVEISKVDVRCSQIS